MRLGPRRCCLRPFGPTAQRAHHPVAHYTHDPSTPSPSTRPASSPHDPNARAAATSSKSRACLGLSRLAPPSGRHPLEDTSLTGQHERRTRLLGQVKSSRVESSRVESSRVESSQVKSPGFVTRSTWARPCLSEAVPRVPRGGEGGEVAVGCGLKRALTLTARVDPALPCAPTPCAPRATPRWQ